MSGYIQNPSRELSRSLFRLLGPLEGPACLIKCTFEGSYPGSFPSHCSHHCNLLISQPPRSHRHDSVTRKWRDTMKDGWILVPSPAKRPLWTLVDIWGSLFSIQVAEPCNGRCNFEIYRACSFNSLFHAIRDRNQCAGFHSCILSVKEQLDQSKSETPSSILCVWLLVREALEGISQERSL